MAGRHLLSCLPHEHMCFVYVGRGSPSTLLQGSGSLPSNQSAFMEHSLCAGAMLDSQEMAGRKQARPSLSLAHIHP
jgi:hypothetical protein